MPSPTNSCSICGNGCTFLLTHARMLVPEEHTRCTRGHDIRISFYTREKETVHTMRTNDLRRTSATLYKYIYTARKTGVENAKVAKPRRIHSLLAGDEQLRSGKYCNLLYLCFVCDVDFVSHRMGLSEF